MGNALIKIGDALFFVVILYCIQVYQALLVSWDQARIPFFIILEGAQAIEDLVFWRKRVKSCTSSAEC